MEEALDIVELISTEFPDGSSVFHNTAPVGQAAPYAVYRIVGNDEEESLEGNVGGGGYLTQFDCYALAPHLAIEFAANIRKALEGRRFAPSGVSVRIDFEQERDAGAFTTSDTDEEVFGWSFDLTFFIGD